MIELSADLGEGAVGEDEIWPLIGAANVACGGHAGDRESMSNALRKAVVFGVRLGAHPSYPDRENFGRRSLTMAPEQLQRSLVMQLRDLLGIAEAAGIRLERVKPHGALYNDAHRDHALAAIIVDAMVEVDPTLALVAPDRSEMAAAARAAGLPVLREAFADRRYTADGALVSRATPGALLTVAEAAAQSALLAAEGQVMAIDGTRVTLSFDTLCIHADMEAAAERLRAVRKALGR